MEKTEKTAWETAEDFILRLLLEKAQQEPRDVITEDFYDKKEALFKELIAINTAIGRASRIEPDSGPGEDKPPVD
jgi:hypothetical protein